METIQVEIRITTEDAKALDKLAGSLFSRDDMAAILLHAEVQAIKDNDGRFGVPRKFAAVKDENRYTTLNEPAKVRR